MSIEAATRDDLDQLAAVYHDAFPPAETADVTKIITELTKASFTSNVLSLVYKDEGNIVASISFSPVFFADDVTIQGYLLAPWQSTVHAKTRA